MPNFMNHLPPAGNHAVPHTTDHTVATPGSAITQVANSLPKKLEGRMAAIKIMIFDVDGVLTDGGLYYGPEGEAIKRFNVLDGLGIKFLHQFGIQTAIISARLSSITARRAADLGISHVFQGSHDKQAALSQLMQQTGLELYQIGYLGDDVIDLPLLKQVGFAATVPNCHPEVLAHVHYVTQAPGGHGAAREICDMLLRAHGHYRAALASFHGSGAL
jgi:3-deoxy-D-manno-octulosonate 8-phosphate phosphatase (KDO 8-P phosphatase)